MKKILSVFVPVVSFFTLVGTALAEVDPDIASVSGVMVTDSRDNLFAFLNANIGTIAAIFIAIFAIGLAIRLIRRAGK